jgi:hypothetical protein
VTVPVARIAGSAPASLQPEPSSKVRSLAHAMRALKASTGKKFVLMLGAGASLSSGVKTTREIIDELLRDHGADLTGTPDERLDKLWERSTPDLERAYLAPYLEDHQPSLGYRDLAVLIQRGFFDLALTFNYDRLVEQALDNLGFTDFKVVISGETQLDEIAKLVEEPEAAFTLLKLHGSLRSTNKFLLDQAEMSEYPETLNKLVGRLTERHIIICGYGFNDANVACRRN